MSHIENKKREKRLALMKSAYDLFTEKGFEHATISDISERAGVAKGTFYLYFRDKTDIRAAVTRTASRQMLQQSCARLDERIETSGLSMDAADIFIFIINDILETVTADQQLLRFLSKHLSWGLFHSYERDHDPISSPYSSPKDIENFVLDMLDRYGIRLRDVRLLIFTLLELVSSTCYDVILFEEPVSIEKYRPYLNDCIRLLVNASILSE